MLKKLSLLTFGLVFSTSVFAETNCDGIRSLNCMSRPQKALVASAGAVGAGLYAFSGHVEIEEVLNRVDENSVQARLNGAQSDYNRVATLIKDAKPEDKIVIVTRQAEDEARAAAIRGYERGIRNSKIERARKYFNRLRQLENGAALTEMERPTRTIMVSQSEASAYLAQARATRQNIVTAKRLTLSAKDLKTIAKFGSRRAVGAITGIVLGGIVVYQVARAASEVMIANNEANIQVESYRTANAGSASQ